VIYAAVSGQSPVISGGLQVTGWKLLDADKNLWSAPVPTGFKNTRQLYVNGVRADRTRGRLPVTLTKTNTGYTADSPLMAGWRNPSDMEFVYTGGNSIWSEHSEGLGDWTEPRCPVAKIEGTVITMAEPCWDNSTKRVDLPPLPDSTIKRRAANLVGPASIGKEPTYVENAYELLGTPGQWYCDQAAGTIYYVPRTGEDMTKADVEVSVLEKLISGEGTEVSPIHNIIFQGLQFSYATWLFPNTSEGFSDIQANYMVTGPTGYATQGLCDLVPNGQCPFGVWTKISGNVAFAYDRQIQFLRDAFVHLGAAGLDLGNGSQADTVQGCVFTDVSGNGLELGGVDLPEGTPAQVTCDNHILNNHIYNVAVEFHDGIGICVGYAQRTVIQYNQIDHLPYSGISMGWGGWPDKIKRAGVANNSENNLVANNLIFDHMQLLADGGGIYTQGLTGSSLANGEKLMGNVIHDQYGSGHGIYTDNGCKNVTAKNNVIFHTNHDNWGTPHGDYYDGNAGKQHDAFDFEDNYWQQGDPDSSAESVTLKNNHIISALDQAPASILQNAGLQTAFKDILTERFNDPCAPESPSRVAATSGNGSVFVAWNPPVFDGGFPVKSYKVTSSKGDEVTLSGDDFRAKGYATFSGLVSGKDYTFTVVAHNANGDSPPSLPSLKINVSAAVIQPPPAPSSVEAYPGDGVASVHFQSPDKVDAGSPIIGYVCTVNPGAREVKITGRITITLGGKHAIFSVIDGLENGKAYTLEMAAVNAAGTGAKSPPVSVTPIAAK